MRLFTAKKVRSGLVTAWRLAGWPTRRSPSSVKATIEGVVRMPSAFSITLGFLPSMTATHELVVPRSMPMTFAIPILLFRQADRTRDGVHHREEHPPAGPQKFSWFARKGGSRPPLVRVAGHIRKPFSGRKHHTGRKGRKSTEVEQ